MVSTILKVTLGLLALLLGFGFVGLAGVSVIVNLVTMLILLYLVIKIFFRPQLEFNRSFSKEMLGLSYPLMINNLLATLFFRVDVTLLQPMKGDTVVGWYTAAYKFIDGVNIIPSTFTIAIFPIISRFAQGARESLIKAYTLAVKALLIVSLPLALLVTFYARGLILIFGGSEYLPHSAIALSLLIWYAPVGFINSVTQYLLIAINQQRFLTRAFIIGLTFNIVANLIFIPSYGYQAAAVITILSEIALFLPFYYAVRQHLTTIPWLSLAWRPALSTLFMGAFLWWFKGLNFLLLVPSSLLLYLVTLVALGTFTQEEIAIVRELIPLRKRPPEEMAPPR
jgi:O-antigen/teichoic acid export membrane protein